MKWFFVLGRNPLLSREEIFSYLEARGEKYSVVVFKKNLLILESNFEFRIEEFGGVVRIGRIFFEGSPKEFKKYVEGVELVEGRKFSYGFIGNFGLDFLRKKFSEEKKKAMLKHGFKRLKFVGGGSVQLAKAEHYFFGFESKGRIYFGKVEQNCNYKEIEKRDMGRPVGRGELAISPRLAKILVNLSGAKEGDVLLDPFCGVGVILQEALLKRINVVGVDKDARAIKGAKKNLEWLVKRYGVKGKYELHNVDIRKFFGKFRAIASECPFGKLIKKKPKKREAEKFIEDFNKRIFPLLAAIKKLKKNNGFFAVSFPKIEDFGVDRRRLKEVFEVVKGPFLDYKPRQLIKREIFVLK